MTVDLLPRLAVLLACAAVLGAFCVRLARPPDLEASSGPDGAVPRPLPGALNGALGAFVVVAGGAAVTGIGLAESEGTGLTLVRVAGVALLIAAGLLAVVALPEGRRLGSPAVIGLAWIGAGLALVSPLVLLVAAFAIVLLAVRVVERPAS